MLAVEYPWEEHVRRASRSNAASPADHGSSTTDQSPFISLQVEACVRWVPSADGVVDASDDCVDSLAGTNAPLSTFAKDHAGGLGSERPQLLIACSCARGANRALPQA